MLFTNVLRDGTCCALLPRGRFCDPPTRQSTSPPHSWSCWPRLREQGQPRRSSFFWDQPSAWSGLLHLLLHTLVATASPQHAHPSTHTLGPETDSWLQKDKHKVGGYRELTISPSHAELLLRTVVHEDAGNVCTIGAFCGRSLYPWLWMSHIKQHSVC